MTTGALPRVIRRAGTRRRDTGTRCELCRQLVSSEHRHPLDAGSGDLLCVCQACSILFGRPAASDGHYRLLPSRRVPLVGVDAVRLGVPVGLAFFVVQQDGAVLAHYPSPAGATRWQIEPEAWHGTVAGCPALAGLAPGVEALLLNTTGGRREAWLVPIDDCYRVVAIVRREWEGMTGGDHLQPEIGNFFDALRRRHGADPGR